MRGPRLAATSVLLLVFAVHGCVGTRDTYLAEMAAEYCDWIARCDGRRVDHCVEAKELIYLVLLDDCAIEHGCAFVPGGAPECTESMRAAECNMGADQFDAAAIRACAGYWDCGDESFAEVCHL